MTDDFLTMGLQNDRYLKALRLIDQFESEIEAIVIDVGRQMIDEQPDLFGQNPDPRVKTARSPRSGLAFSRVHYSMSGPESADSDQNLNVHLYWMPPTEYNRTDINGALRAFGYKIKNAEQSIDDKVAEQTRDGDWPLETSDNPYDSNIVFYQHVSSAAEIESTADTLVSHFSELGDAYAID